MSENEIIKNLNDLLEHNYLEDVGYLREENDYVIYNNAIRGLLDLYKKEKEKNEELLKDNNALNRLVYFNKNITFPYETELTSTNNYISKDKIREVLEKYKYTEIVDSTKIIEFYKAIQNLLEEN